MRAIAAVVVAAVIGLVLWAIFKPSPPAPGLPVVEVEPVQAGNVNIYGEYVGRIRAQQFVEVRARVEGYLERILFEEGTFVRRGQTLFVIDPQVYRARVQKARAQLTKPGPMPARPSVIWRESRLSTSRTRPRSSTSTMPRPHVRAPLPRSMWLPPTSPRQS